MNSTSITETFALCERLGLRVCDIPPGSKGPVFSKGWNAHGNWLTEAPQNGHGLGLLHAWSGTCAVDIDSADAAALLALAGVDLQALIDAPDACGYSSGKPDRLKLLYKVPPFLHLITEKVEGDSGKMGYELRCWTKTGNSDQDVLPPSIHPETKKSYFWLSGSLENIPQIPQTLLQHWLDLNLRSTSGKAPSSASKAPDSQSAGPCSDGDYELALDALQSLSADCSYSDWVAVGMALSTTGRPDAFGHWAMWSATAPDKCPSSRELGTKWASFTGRPNGVGLGTLFQLARQAGWVRPAPDASSLFAAIPDPVAVPNAEADPFVRLDDIDDATIDPPAFTVDELLPAGEVTLLGAHGGVGKTALAQHIAVCLATGRNCLGKDCRKSRVLFYSAEDGADQMRWKFKRECERLGISSTELDSGLKLIDASEADPTLFHEIKTGGARVGGVTAEFVRLQRLMQATGCDVLIVDNASDVFAGDENNRAQVRGFIRALRTLVAGTCGAVLLLVHVDKMTARTGGSESYSGSTAWHNSVRSRLVLTADATVADGLMLEQQKSNRGRKADPIVMQWVDGLPTFRGNYSETSTSDTDVMHLIAELVHEYHERGESLSTSQTAHTNAHKVLASDRKFPKIAKVRFWDLLREAERHLLIEREIYRTPQRKEAERWRRANNWSKAGAPSAPSAPS